MKRIVSFVLIVVMLAASLFGCGGKQEETYAIETSGDLTEQTGEDTAQPDIDAPDEDPADPRDVKIGGVPLEKFSVVTAKEPASAEKNAAEDLCRLIEFAAGLKLPLLTDDEASGNSIVIGVTALDNELITEARAEVKDDGYAMIESGGNLYISGAIARGTMNGVYDFLQDYLGVRFYSDTFTYVRRDHLKNVAAGQRTVFEPAFAGRYNWTVSGETNNRRFAKRTKSTSIKYAGSHNLGSLSGTGDGFSKQPCLSDPQVFGTVFKNLCKQIENKPNKTFFHINQNDGGAFCTCPECTAKNEAAGGTAMGSLLMFINDIAAAVKEKYPDREIDILTYAYKETTIMPDPEVVKPADNVIIVLCMMDSTCFTHAYPDPGCEHNRISYANMVNWSKVCKKFVVYDYTYNFASTVSSVGPNLDVLWDNMQAFRKCGCIGLLLEGDHMAEAGEFTELRNYLINRLMWDPNITKEDYDLMRAEFMEDFYGQAAPYLSEYIDLMNATSRRAGLTEWNGHTSVYTDPKVFYAPKVDGKKDHTVIDKCEQLWEAALSCTLTDEQFAHVEKSSVHFYDFLSRFSGSSKTRKAAEEIFKAMCDKYTYDYDGSLPRPGKSDLQVDVPSEGLQFREYPDGGLYVCDRGEFCDGMLVIPAEHGGKKVVSVGKSAFARAANVKELHVEEGITYIGAYAFRGCKSLKTVYLPATLRTLGFGAFGISGDEQYGCDRLTDIYYAGTADMWQALYQTDNGVWKTLKDVTVHCSDKTVVIEAGEAPE